MNFEFPKNFQLFKDWILEMVPKYHNISSFYIQNFKAPASFCDCAGQFVSYLVENPEGRF